MTMTEPAPVTGAVTTRFAGATKAWSWNYTKVKNADICPKRHYEIDIAKLHKDTAEDDPNSALAWGKRVHEAMASRLSKKTTLPIEMIDYESFAVRLENQIATIQGDLQVEQKYAINQDFGPTGYFAPDVWYRGIGDVCSIVAAGPMAGRVALVADWKTGRVLEDSVQLALMAQCIFSYYPTVEKVMAKFIWLKEHAVTDEKFTRQDMVRFWTTMLPRVARLKLMADTMNYPATPNDMCAKWCPVTACPHHGKRYR